MDPKTRDIIKNLPDSLPLGGAGEPHVVHTRIFIEGIPADEYERLKALKREPYAVKPPFGIDMDPVTYAHREDGAIVRPGSELALGWMQPDGTVQWNPIALTSGKDHD